MALLGQSAGQRNTLTLAASLHQQLMHDECNVHVLLPRSYAACINLSAIKNLALRRRPFRAKTNTNCLACHQEQIRRAEQKIPSPQAARLCAQPEQPFQSRSEE